MAILKASPQNALLFISETGHLENQLKPTNSLKPVIEFSSVVFSACIRKSVRWEQANGTGSVRLCPSVWQWLIVICLSSFTSRVYKRTHLRTHTESSSIILKVFFFIVYLLLWLPQPCPSRRPSERVSGWGRVTTLIIFPESKLNGEAGRRAGRGGNSHPEHSDVKRRSEYNQITRLQSLLQGQTYHTSQKSLYI